MGGGKKAEGCQVVKVVVLLDRHQGGSDEIRRKGYDFRAILSADAAGEVGWHNRALQPPLLWDV